MTITKRSYNRSGIDSVHQGLRSLQAVSDLLCNLGEKQMEFVSGDNLCSLLELIIETLDSGADELQQELSDNRFHQEFGDRVAPGNRTANGQAAHS